MGIDEFLKLYSPAESDKSEEFNFEFDNQESDETPFLTTTLDLMDGFLELNGKEIVPPMSETPGQVTPEEPSHRVTSSSRPKRSAKKSKMAYDDDIASVASVTTSSRTADEEVPRNRKNALAAKQNREKKKAYVQGLENENLRLKAENQTLKKESVEMKQEVEQLREETAYLRNVLANQTTLSSLLANINAGPSGGNRKVKLSSFNKPSQDPQPLQAKGPTTTSTTTGGICLHVANSVVSLELCSRCATMASHKSEQSS